MSLIAKKPNKKFDNNFVGTSVLGFVLQSNYKATVLWGMLIVVFASRLKFTNSELPRPYRIPEPPRDARSPLMPAWGTGRWAALAPGPCAAVPQGAFSASPHATVWPLLLTLAPAVPRPLHTRQNRFVVKYQDSGKDSVWEAPSGRIIGPNGILFVVSVDPSPTLLSGERGSFPMGSGVPGQSSFFTWQGIKCPP